MPTISLDELADAYQRTQRAITRAIETDAALERDRDIVDDGFFLLIFGQIERRITDLAVEKVERSAEKQYLRGRNAGFDRKIEIALRDQSDELKEDLTNWYGVRSDIAHGRSLASGIEIGPVLASAGEIDVLLVTIQQQSC
jgi:hypothetical protein